MPTTSANQGLILPSLTDAANMVTTMASYNNGVEPRLVLRFLSIADRTARMPIPDDGMIGVMLDTGTPVLGKSGVWTSLVTANVLGWVGQNVQAASITSTNAGGHIETFGAAGDGAVTANLIAGARYAYSYTGSITGTVGDACYIRLRYKQGAVCDATGTQLTGGLRAEYQFASGSIRTVSITGTFVAPASTQYTVAVSIDWYAGGANDISLYATAGVSEPLGVLTCVASP
jgi:hypothetical protein